MTKLRKKGNKNSECHKDDNENSNRNNIDSTSNKNNIYCCMCNDIIDNTDDPAKHKG